MVETPKLVGECLGSGLSVDFVVVPGDVEPPEAVLAAADAARVDVFGVDRAVFDGLSETQTAQPALAVVEAPALELDDRLIGRGAVRLLVLVDVADPGNVGTLLRTAEATGCRGVIAAGATADVLSPKVVRASAGSMLRLPLAEAGIDETMDALFEAEVTTVATDMNSQSYDQADLSADRLAIVLGNEAHGLAAEVFERCDLTVSIPMAGAVESLNVATAGAVLTFELARRDRPR